MGTGERPPPVTNHLKLYTDMQTLPKDEVLLLEEFAGLGPKRTVEELSRVWINLNVKQPWAVVIVDPLGFTDALWAITKDEAVKKLYGNCESWDLNKQRDFYQKVMAAKNTLVIFEGLRNELPMWYRAFDRTVVVAAPGQATPAPRPTGCL